MKKFIQENKDRLSHYFANGDEIVVENIKPKLIEVKHNTEKNKLFKFATLNWSVPVSQGFGRRMRFVVIDENNNKLIGIIGLGDPVFNLKSRDLWIGWDVKDRKKRLVNVMDAFVLGALPPYSNLIGGKLIASLLISNDIQKVFKKKYWNKKSIIKKRINKPKLCLITTNSALGKSSIYDRLKIYNEKRFLKIGETNGYGHFHVPDELFNEMKIYLENINHKYANGNRFGDGPNWKFRVIRKTLSVVGLDDNYLLHGIKREIYAIPLANNCKEFLKGNAKRLKMKTMETKEIAEFCKKRWMIPRAERDKSYLDVKTKETIDRMISI